MHQSKCPLQGGEQPSSHSCCPACCKRFWLKERPACSRPLHGSTQLACCLYHICSLASLHEACTAASGLPLWVSASQWCQQSLCVNRLQDNRRLAKQFSSGHNEYGYGNQEETLASRRDSATRSAHRDQVRTVRVHSFAEF